MRNGSKIPLSICEWCPGSLKWGPAFPEYTKVTGNPGYILIYTYLNASDNRVIIKEWVHFEPSHQPSQIMMTVHTVRPVTLTHLCVNPLSLVP